MYHKHCMCMHLPVPMKTQKTNKSSNFKIWCLSLYVAVIVLYNVSIGLKLYIVLLKCYIKSLVADINFYKSIYSMNMVNTHATNILYTWLV